MRYYVLEEDHMAECKIYLGNLDLNWSEEKAMILGETAFIATEPICIPLKRRPVRGRSDFLNTQLTLVSNKLKNLIKEKARDRVFFRATYLIYDGWDYSYYYMSPIKYDGVDRASSSYLSEGTNPGGLWITGGFSIMSAVVGKSDIFRLKGLSNRKIIISERLKETFEDNGIQGVQYIETTEFNG